MSPEQIAERNAALLVARNAWGGHGRELLGAFGDGYCAGWADGRGVVAMRADRGTVRLIPPGTTHMQYGRERRMAIADYLDSPHYDASGWVPVRRTFKQDAPGVMTLRVASDMQWFIWTPKGWV